MSSKTFFFNNVLTYFRLKIVYQRLFWLVLFLHSKNENVNQTNLHLTGLSNCTVYYESLKLHTIWFDIEHFCIDNFSFSYIRKNYVIIALTFDVNPMQIVAMWFISTQPIVNLLMDISVSLTARARIKSVYYCEYPLRSYFATKRPY